jgi:hypothetical protein
MPNATIIAEIQRAKSTALQGYEALWNSRLELLTRAGDMAALLQHLRSPVELAGDNCSCNSACGSLEHADVGMFTARSG